MGLMLNLPAKHHTLEGHNLYKTKFWSLYRSNVTQAEIAETMRDFTATWVSRQRLKGDVEFKFDAKSTPADFVKLSQCCPFPLTETPPHQISRQSFVAMTASPERYAKLKREGRLDG